MKATNTLFARLLMIAKSSREINLKDVISNYEFTAINSTLMKSDGSLLTSDSKSDLIYALESLATGEETNSEDNIDSHLNTLVVVDGMSVVHEKILQQVSKKKKNRQKCGRFLHQDYRK